MPLFFFGFTLNWEGKKDKVEGFSVPTEINPVYAFGLLTYNEKKAIKFYFYVIYDYKLIEPGESCK